VKRPGVNFTNLCSPVEKSPAHSVRQKICRSISPTFCSDEICLICMEICQIYSPFTKCHLPKKLYLVCGEKPRKYVGEIDPRWGGLSIQRPIYNNKIKCTAVGINTNDKKWPLKYFGSLDVGVVVVVLLKVRRTTLKESLIKSSCRNNTWEIPLTVRSAHF